MLSARYNPCRAVFALFTKPVALPVMEPQPGDHLPLRQKAKLAFSVFIIYWPIRFYQNLPGFDGGMLSRKLPFFLVEMALTFVLLLGWIQLIDWWQQRLIPRLDRGAPGSIRFPVQLFTLVVAVGLALGFNNVFGWVHGRMDDGLERRFPALGQAPDRSRPGPRGDNGQRRRMNNGLTVMGLLSAFYLVANRRSNQQVQQLQLRAERLEKEAVQAQFDALKNQVSPHFLFNSLSILSSLVEVDPKLSIQFINRLSKAYRYILEQRENERVSLRTELDFLAAYTFLLTIRFEGKLYVTIDVPEADRDRFMIAPLTLQLLLENAVKHNQLSEENPLIVTITLLGETLQVSNPIRLRPVAENSTGMGLQNIVNRYALLTTRPVEISEHTGEFVVTIPLLQ